MSMFDSISMTCDNSNSIETNTKENVLLNELYGCSLITTVKRIPTTTIILIKCVVGIPLFMIKKTVKNGIIPTTIILKKTP